MHSYFKMVFVPFCQNVGLMVKEILKLKYPIIQLAIILTHRYQLNLAFLGECPKRNLIWQLKHYFCLKCSSLFNLKHNLLLILGEILSLFDKNDLSRIFSEAIFYQIFFQIFL